MKFNCLLKIQTNVRFFKNSIIDSGNETLKDRGENSENNKFRINSSINQFEQEDEEEEVEIDDENEQDNDENEEEEEDEDISSINQQIDDLKRASQCKLNFNFILFF